MMRTVLAIIFYLFSAAEVSAQDRYFLCIQSEDHQPFYVRVSNKTWSSSAVGNVVVPSLGDSTYQVSVGFPRNKYPEQNYLITFNRKDLGFTLKQSGDEGWSLVNWATSDRVSPRAGQAAEGIWYGEKKKEDAFTQLMANVVNDSAVLYVASVKELPGKQEVFAKAEPAVDSTLNMVVDTAVAVSGAVAVAIDTVANSRIDTALAVSTVADSLKTAAIPAGTGMAAVDTVDRKVDSTVTAGTSLRKDTSLGGSSGPILVYTAPKASVLKLQDYAHEKGRTIIYTDSLASGVDTISVVIELDPDTLNSLTARSAAGKVAEVKAAPDSVKSIVPDSAKANVPNTTAVVKKEPPVEPEVKKEAPAETVAVTKKETPAETIAPAKKDTIAETEADKKKLVLINSDCSNFATDNDIDKLRVKILAETTIDGKLAATKKIFKSKCIYTRQIRALSELYPNDEARYRFFEQCYPFTADTSAFRSLLSLLSEDAYIARFKTLVRLRD